MRINHLTLQNFRNYADQTVAFDSACNVICGENAQGKTNLLEGIYTFARGKSFRSASDTELCRFGESSYALSLLCRTAVRDISLAYRFSDGRRERRLGGAPVSRLSEMIGHFRAVLFYPDHLQLLKGGPSERRLFLNIAISQLDPLYLSSLSRYEKLLTNRNSLLKAAQKTGQLDHDLIYAYSEGMAQECALIHRTRAAYIDKLNEEAGAWLSALSGERERLALTYESDVPDGTREGYLTRLTDNLSREAAAGCSLYGVQRDEMKIEINGKDARTYASQGQARSVVLCLKLGEGEAARRIGGEYPVFLFDDVLSELDEKRRAYLLSEIHNKQVIMTSCERVSADNARIIRVRNGTYEEER